MAKLTLGGLPVHPLFNLPLASLTMAGVSDAVALVTGQRSWARTAHHLLVFGVTGGVISGLPGLIDYEAIAERSEAKRAATTHAILNAGLLFAALAGLLLRRDHPERPGILAQMISILSVPLWVYSAIQGGILASRYGLDQPAGERTAA